MHPEAFHGRGKTNTFFEGWYIKLVIADQSQRWAIIPGVFHGPKGSEQDMAFVQVLDGLTGRSWFHEFERSDFQASTTHFEVRIGPNTFDSSGVNLQLPEISGRINFVTKLDGWPVSWREPGIMGWYGMVPMMECFHGVVSFGHQLSGTLDISGAAYSFDAGKGYIEKDWGKSFPAGYVWLATNHLDNAPDASIVASVAIIPWLRNSFRGFVIGFKHSSKLHKWTTYNGSKELSLTIDDSHVLWSLVGPDGVLEIRAERVKGGLLHAPLRTAMYQRVEETLDAEVEIKHTAHDGRVLYEGTGACAGLEVFGDIQRLLGTRPN